MKTLSPLKVTLFSLTLLVLGFIIGLGYQSYQNAAVHQKSATATAPPSPPVTRSLRVSPDDQLVAFTAIYHGYNQSSRFVFDLKNYHWNAVDTPTGWQDSMVQWGNDGRTLLYERSKIPQIVTGAEAGLYSEKITTDKNAPQWEGQQQLSKNLHQSGERIYAGFWTAQNHLVVKTQHSDRSLFTINNGKMTSLDHSPGTYYQNRAISTAQGNDYYVVRDIDRGGKQAALFRIHDQHTTQIGQPFGDIIWAYLSENAKWLLLCSNAPNGEDWIWTLWQVQNDTLKKVKTAQVPGDVIAVYWSPDFKHILGAVGNGLWLIEVPSLKVRKIGKNNDWHADDAAWFNHENAILVAAEGKLWKVDVSSGKRTEIWKFPNKYWE